MASPYDYYRTAPAQVTNPMQTRGSPEMYYAPSDSLWGNYRARATEGSAFTGPYGMGLGVAPMALSGVLPGGMRGGLGQGAMWSGGGPVSTAGLTSAGLGSLWNGMGGAGAFKSGDMLKNLGRMESWKNVGSFGASGARDKQRDAENRRRAAVEAWRYGQLEQLGARLGQKGQDVQGDLGGELRKALWAGDDLMSDPNAVQDAMTKFQQRYQQYMLGRQRAGQARQVDAMMNDPRRLSDRNQRLAAERTQGLSQLAERYRIGQRGNAFNQARRGTMGSSMDVEQQGELGRARDTGAMALQSGLDEKARQYRLGDQQQANTLKGLIYADDPNTAAAFSRTLEGIGAQGRLLQEQQAVQGQLGAARSAAATGYSQAFGGLMSSASRPLGYYIEHQGSGA